MDRPIDQCRYDATIAVDPDAKIPGDNIIKSIIPGGQYLLVHFSGTSKDIGLAIGHAIDVAVSKASRQFDHTRPIFELYETNCDAGESPGSFHCELCIPA